MQENKFWQTLEAYIETHRTDLDVDEPRTDLWSSIAEQLPNPPRRVWWRQPQLWRAAAMLMIALGLSYWWITRLADKKPVAISADMGQEILPGAANSAPQKEWDALEKAYQPRLDSLEQVAGTSAQAYAPLQQVNSRIDSLAHAGPATSEGVDLLEKLYQQKESLLRSVQP